MVMIRFHRTCLPDRELGEGGKEYKKQRDRRDPLNYFSTGERERGDGGRGREGVKNGARQ